MNVKKLRKALKKYPDDMPVVLAKDEEGNYFSPLYEAAESMYEAETTYSGRAIHPDDYDPEDYPDAFRALILWPVN